MAATAVRLPNLGAKSTVPAAAAATKKTTTTSSTTTSGTSTSNNNNNNSSSDHSTAASTTVVRRVVDKQTQEDMLLLPLDVSAEETGALSSIATSSSSLDLLDSPTALLANGLHQRHSPIYQTSQEMPHVFGSATSSKDDEPEEADPVAAATNGAVAMAVQPKRTNSVYRLVLTGGPCGGKTTGQERLATYFEQMGWKVFTVPETATILLGGGVKFAELSAEQAYQFQLDLLLTLLRIEDTLFRQAAMIEDRNVLVICDRGAMDPSAYVDSTDWQRMLKDLNLCDFELRDNRYNQIVHMVTAADGAEQFYTTANNRSRKEGVSQAVSQDRVTRNAWLGHPYVDVIDNEGCRHFDDKILQLIKVVCDRAGVDSFDRLSCDARKRKWLIDSIDEAQFANVRCERFRVQHDYLCSDRNDVQVRIRTRCQNNRTTYQLTQRYKRNSAMVETRNALTEKDYIRYLKMRDFSRQTIYKTRRCFSFGSHFFNLDTYEAPLPPQCEGRSLAILETHTARKDVALPDFLQVVKEVTGLQEYSMYSLSYLHSYAAAPSPATPPKLASEEAATTELVN